MSWETTSTLEGAVSPAEVLAKAYGDSAAWPGWNAELRRAELDQGRRGWRRR